MVISNFFDVVGFRELFDKGFNEFIVNNIFFCCFDVILFFLNIIKDVVMMIF